VKTDSAPSNPRLKMAPPLLITVALAILMPKRLADIYAGGTT
jgi:hypothetical protein